MTYQQANKIKKMLAMFGTQATIVPVQYVAPGNCIGAAVEPGIPLTTFGLKIGNKVYGSF